MEGSRPCKSCGKSSLVRDDVSAYLVCTSCGFVQDCQDFQAYFNGFKGPPEGTFVRVGTSGTGSSLNYKEKKILEAQKTMDDIVFRLGFSGPRKSEVKEMVEKITEGEYGLGDWFPILVGACAYVVMRTNKKSLSIAEMVSVIGCDIHELGRMVARVVDFLDLKLPEFDIVNSFERAIQTCPSFRRVSRDKVERMLKQGIFLVQCAVKWFLTTGRRPLPMVAAVLILVAELNEVDVQIEDVATEVHAAVATSKMRYKELLEALVEVGKGLPWGKDITIKNIVKNAPFVIQYMEIKSRSKHGEKRKNLEDVGYCVEDVVSDCLREEAGYAVHSNVFESDSHCFKAEDGSRFSRSSIDDLENLKVSHECLSMIYSKFLNDFSRVKAVEECRDDCGRKQKNRYELNDACHEWWSGKSELCKKLFLEQVLAKDVGFDALPPSFVTGCLATERRREKINAAKLRIDKVINPTNIDSANAGDVCLFDDRHSGKKRKRRHDGIDWEDVVIETLLLHQVKEEEIEKGNYKSLLGLCVFNSGV
ncbi:plant-specific TFIIB-related protein PTF2 [Malania oleifera]|uniref:plant-specific TFIIB-related protein PTF2 n=1 Tax=Malania oleifera TaxID=397392 RepID=UPI0025AE54FF|nr:plant-specific TFIIB-related protein PTF2 [Malania oleifera]